MYFDKYRVKLIASTPISMITGDTSILFLDVLAERFDKDLSEQEQQSNARSSEDYQFIQLKARFDKESVDSIIYLTDNSDNADILSCRYGEVEENNTSDLKEAHLHSVARAIVQFTFFPLLQNKYGMSFSQALSMFSEVKDHLFIKRMNGILGQLANNLRQAIIDCTDVKPTDKVVH